MCAGLGDHKCETLDASHVCLGLHPEASTLDQVSAITLRVTFQFPLPPLANVSLALPWFHVRDAAAGFTVDFQTARFDGRWHNDQARVDLIARCYALNPEPLNFPRLPFDFGPEL